MGRQLYLLAVGKVLGEWQALRMAVDNSFGGAHSQEKAEWMVEVTGEFVWDNWPVSVDEVEDYVGAIMDQEFDTLLEDGSLPKISKQLCALRQVCLNGNQTDVDEFFSKQGCVVSPASKEELPDRPDTEDLNVCSTSKPVVDSSVIVDGLSEAVGCMNIDSSQQDLCEETNKTSTTEDGDGWTVVSKGKRKQR